MALLEEPLCRVEIIKDLTKEDVATIAGAAREEGWKIFGCSTPVFKCEIDQKSVV